MIPEHPLATVVSRGSLGSSNQDGVLLTNTSFQPIGDTIVTEQNNQKERVRVNPLSNEAGLVTAQSTIHESIPAHSTPTASVSNDSHISTDSATDPSSFGSDSPTDMARLTRQDPRDEQVNTDIQSFTPLDDRHHYLVGLITEAQVNGEYDAAVRFIRMMCPEIDAMIPEASDPWAAENDLYILPAEERTRNRKSIRLKKQTKKKRKQKSYDLTHLIM